MNGQLDRTGRWREALVDDDQALEAGEALGLDQGALRDVLFVEAVEELDGEGVLLDLDERDRATREARAAADGAGGERFLAERARCLRERLVRDHPGLDRALALAATPTPPAWLVLVGALLLGMAVDRLDGSERLNLLSFSLLGLLAWNLAIYPLRALATLARGAGFARSGAAGRIALWVAGAERPWCAWRRERNSLLAAVHARFLAQWGHAAGPVLGARLRCALDLGAAGLALGILGGLYLRGLVFEYRAGWESTFLDAEQVQSLLSVLLAPGSLLLGHPVPDAATLAGLRGSDGGAPAAEWIHLFAATCLALAIVPRLVLGAWAARKARTLAGNLTLDPGQHPSLARLLAADRGRGRRVQLESYSYGLSPEAERGLRVHLGVLFGERADLGSLSRVAYGDEAVDGSTGSSCVVVFNAGQCPEREVHLVHLTRRRDCLAQGEVLLAVVDESVLGRRLGEGEEAGERLSERRRAWDELLAEVGLAALHCDLEGRAGSEALSAARAALWPGPLREATP